MYEAVDHVNRNGTKLKLVRLGDDHVDFLGSSRAQLERNVIRVTYCPRADVPRYLALADVLVQPGKPSEFNDYRLPSKLPEFLAMGKPVILPQTNLGHLLEDGENCLLLKTGEPRELAGRLQECLGDPALRKRLREGARTFAERSFSWSRSAPP